MDAKTDEAAQMSDSNAGFTPARNGTAQQMPRYKSHKHVWALKIRGIVRDGQGTEGKSDTSAIIYPEELGYAPFRVDAEYMAKHKPTPGGYYVVYEGDGYKSFSPAKAFEEGYSPAEPA